MLDNSHNSPGEPTKTVLAAGRIKSRNEMAKNPSGSIFAPGTKVNMTRAAYGAQKRSREAGGRRDQANAMTEKVTLGRVLADSDQVHGNPSGSDIIGVVRNKAQDSNRVVDHR